MRYTNQNRKEKRKNKQTAAHRLPQSPLATPHRKSLISEEQECYLCALNETFLRNGRSDVPNRRRQAYVQ